jgi:hypothetical protein
MITVPWTNKPPLGTQLDWSNPLTQGLIFCTPFNEMAGFPQEQIKQKKFATHTGVWQTNGVRYNGTSVFSTISGYGSNTDFSIFTVAYHGGTAANRSMVDQDGASGLARRFQYRVDSAQKFNFTIFNTSQSALNIVCNTAIPANTMFTACGVLSGNTGTAYANNYLPATGTITAPTVGLLDTQDIYIGKRTTSTQAFDGIISFILIFNRAISKAEYQQLAVNPWQIFQPYRIPFAAQSAATIAIWCKVAGSLKAAEAMWIKTGGNLKLVEAINAKVGGAIK